MSRGAAVAVERWNLKSLPPLSDEQFELWQALIEARTGMTIGPSRRTFLETSLAIRMRELDCQDHERYYEQLMLGPAAEREWAVLVDRLTVQETMFFRHASSFALVRDHLRALIALPGRRAINLWSVGCSTGEEPYSLAMLADAEIAATQRRDCYFGVTGTDISLPVLAKCRSAIFGERRLQQVPEDWRQRYFQPLPSSKRDFQVVEALRERVCFAQMNIMQLEQSPLADMDVIFCQNVLIYFRRFRKRDILNHLAERLAPGGLLVIGVGEMVDWSHPLLERVARPDTLAWRRRH